MSQDKKKAAAAKKSRIDAGIQNSGGIPPGGCTAAWDGIPPVGRNSWIDPRSVAPSRPLYSIKYEL